MHIVLPPPNPMRVLTPADAALKVTCPRTVCVTSAMEKLAVSLEKIETHSKGAPSARVVGTLAEFLNAAFDHLEARSSSFSSAPALLRVHVAVTGDVVNHSLRCVDSVDNPGLQTTLQRLEEMRTRYRDEARKALQIDLDAAKAVVEVACASILKIGAEAKRKEMNLEASAQHVERSFQVAAGQQAVANSKEKVAVASLRVRLAQQVDGWSQTDATLVPCSNLLRQAAPFIVETIAAFEALLARVKECAQRSNRKGFVRFVVMPTLKQWDEVVASLRGAQDGAEHQQFEGEAAQKRTRIAIAEALDVSKKRLAENTTQLQRQQVQRAKTALDVIRQRALVKLAEREAVYCARRQTVVAALHAVQEAAVTQNPVLWKQLSTVLQAISQCQRDDVAVLIPQLQAHVNTL